MSSMMMMVEGYDAIFQVGLASSCWVESHRWKEKKVKKCENLRWDQIDDVDVGWSIPCCEMRREKSEVFGLGKRLIGELQYP